MDKFVLERCENGWILSKGHKVNGHFESLHVIQDSDDEQMNRWNFANKMTEFILGEKSDGQDSSN